MTPRDPYIVSMSKLTEPFGQSRDDFELFVGLSRAMGVETAFTEGRSQEQWQRWIYDQTRQRAANIKIDIPDYAQFRKEGWFKLETPAKPTVMLRAFARIRWPIRWPHQVVKSKFSHKLLRHLNMPIARAIRHGLSPVSGLAVQAQPFRCI